MPSSDDYLLLGLLTASTLTTSQFEKEKDDKLTPYKPGAATAEMGDGTLPTNLTRADLDTESTSGLADLLTTRNKYCTQIYFVYQLF